MDNLEDQLRLLKLDLKSYGEEIVQYITSLNFHAQDSAISLKNDPKLVIQMLQQEVLELIKEAQAHSDFLEKNKQDITDCENLVHTLSIICRVVDTITLCEETIDGVNLEVACTNIENLKVSMDSLPSINSEIGSGKVCYLLRREADIIISRFQTRLKRLLKTSIQIDLGKMKVIKKLKGSLVDDDYLTTESISLSNVWYALYRTSIHTECIDMIIKEIFVKVIRPLWKVKKLPFPRISKGDDVCELVYTKDIQGSASMTTDIQALTSTLSYKYEDITHKLGPCRMIYAQLLEHIGMIIGFIWAEIFHDTTEQISNLATEKLLYNDIQLNQKLIDTLTDMIPKAESDLISYQKSIEQPCLDFQNRLFTYGLLNTTSSISTNIASTKPISTSVSAQEVDKENTTNPNNTTATATATTVGQTIEKRFNLLETVYDLKTRYAKARRREILMKARDIVTSDYHNTMIASGDVTEDDPSSAGYIGDSQAVLDQSSSYSLQTLRFEPCHISLTAYRILKLIHDTFKLATTASIELANILIHAARDSLALYLTIVPIKYMEVIETVPHMGAVFYNDCCYIAHNTTLITHTYRKELSNMNDIFQNCIGLIDFIPRFRQIGELKLSKHLDEQKQILDILISQLHLRTDLDQTASSIATSIHTSSLHNKPFVSLNLPSTSRRAQVLSTGLKLVENLGIMGLNKVVGINATDRNQTFHTTTHSEVDSTKMTVHDMKQEFLHTSHTLSSPHDTTGSPTLNTAGSGQEGERRFNSESQATVIIQFLERIKVQWQGVLQQTVYERILGHLIDYIFRAVMKPILESDCIAEECGAEINRIMKILITSARLLSETSSSSINTFSSFTSSSNFATSTTSTTGVNTVTGSTISVEEEKIIQLCPTWKKFYALMYSLEYSLNDIAEQLPRSFTGQEMSKLIKALFEDTPRRQTLLNSVIELTS